MDERFEIEDLPDVEPVKPRLRGRGLALPPLAPIAAAAGILLGLVVGIGLAPKVTPPQAPEVSPTPEATPEVAPTVPAGVIAEVLVDPVPATPPAGGLSLGEALKLLYRYDPSISPYEVVSAFAESQPDLSAGSTSNMRWVWVFVINKSDRVDRCGVLQLETPGVTSESASGEQDGASLGPADSGTWVSRTDVTRITVISDTLTCVITTSYVVELDYMTGEYLSAAYPIVINQ